jgi:hypothetical protein
MFLTYIASVLSRCCVCLQWFSSVFRCFFAIVSQECFKCFIYLQTYVASVVSECFKSRSECCTYCNVTRLLQLLEGARGQSGAQTSHLLAATARGCEGSERGTDVTWGQEGRMQTPRLAGARVECRRSNRVQVRASVGTSGC